MAASGLLCRWHDREMARRENSRAQPERCIGAAKRRVVAPAARNLRHEAATAAEGTAGHSRVHVVVRPEAVVVERAGCIEVEVKQRVAPLDRRNLVKVRFALSDASYMSSQGMCPACSRRRSGACAASESGHRRRDALCGCRPR